MGSILTHFNLIRQKEKSAQAWKAFPPLGLKPRGFHGLKPFFCDANANAAASYLEAWWLLGRDDCRVRAEQVLDYLWATFRTPTGGMHHYWDTAPQVPGLLMDATMTGLALLDAYALLGQAHYLERARQLGTALVQQHRSPSGGFFDISEAGPASLQVPITVLTQNAHVAAFFVRLADLSGQRDYRKVAYGALRGFPNAHRQYEAFTAGFGQALARLLTLPLLLTITGTPGDPSVRALARAGLTQLRHGDVVLQFRASQDGQPASALVRVGEQQVGPVTNPGALTPELFMA